MNAAKKRPRYTRRKGVHYVWVLAFEVPPAWVEDGFDLDDERAHRMLCNELPYALGHELKARVLRTPDPAAIAKEQGAEVQS